MQKKVNVYFHLSTLRLFSCGVKLLMNEYVKDTVNKKTT